MDLKDIKDLSDNLDQKQSNAILGLIDQKINSDMEKVLEKIKSVESEMGTMHKLLWTIVITLFGLILSGIIGLGISLFNH